MSGWRLPKPATLENNMRMTASIQDLSGLEQKLRRPDRKSAGFGRSDPCIGGLAFACLGGAPDSESRCFHCYRDRTSVGDGFAPVQLFGHEFDPWVPA